MIQHNVIQGTQEWLDLRKNFYTASEAPAMKGVSKYKTRTELLNEKKSGIVKDVDDSTQELFDKGHAAEKSAREILEKRLREDLYPITASKGNLLASVDGLTMDGSVAYEHKLWNEEFAAQVRSGIVPETHVWQLEQILYVTGAKMVLFVVSDGTPEKWVELSYATKNESELLEGWKQFETDLQNHVIEAAIEKPVASPVMELPAISYKLNGLALSSNLEQYKEAALVLVDKSKIIIQTDQDFSDCELLNKKLKEAEDKIKQIQANVIGEVSDIDAFTKELGYISELFRQARLNGEKQVKNRKEEIRNEIIASCQSEFDLHIDKINETLKSLALSVRFGRNRQDFATAMKGKKTISSLKDSARSFLAELKIKANQDAYLARINVDLIPTDYLFLFADIQSIFAKENDDFRNLVQMRIQQYTQQQEEKKKAEDAAKAFQESLAKKIEEPEIKVQNFEHPEFSAPPQQEVISLDSKPVLSQSDILAMREFRQILESLKVPKCESVKGDIMATKVTKFLQSAIAEINWK